MKLNTRVALMFAGALAILPFQNCAPNKMAFQNEADMASTAQTELKKQTFSASSKSKAIDMVWVIDNSVSMTNGADRVRKNIEAFARSVGGFADLRIALISKKDSFALNTQVALPANISDIGIQVDFLVHSYNPMLVAAATTCAQASPANVFCGKLSQVSHYSTKELMWSLSDFYRKDAQKVFVFVTDDDSSYKADATRQFDGSGPSGYTTVRGSLVEDRDFMSGQSFLKQVRTAFGAETSVKVFGFLNLPDHRTCQTSSSSNRPSRSYISLIDEVGGKYYDVCASDWSKSFASLTDGVYELVNTEYTLKNVGQVQIIEVRLNDSILRKDEDYKVVGSKVVLAEHLVRTGGSFKVEISYLEN